MAPDLRDDRRPALSPLLRLDDGGQRGRRWRPWAIRLTAVLAVAAVVTWVRQTWFADLDATQRPSAQRIALVTPQRTPPPPEKPPEPRREPEQAEVLVEREPPAAVAVPAEALGVDADAQGAGDGFGLLARRGGRDITTIGDGAASAPSASERVRDRLGHRVYAGTVMQRLRQELGAMRALTEVEYSVVMMLWIDRSGRIVRTDFERASGDVGTDNALRGAFAALPLLPEPPADLPQPLRIRVTSRDLDVARR
ncbi:MAG: TonB C-terminal domain-containing protein [Rubrivivax sp.]|jgi:protein TonB|nr:TonB C-terminal domain-containing protein [Rubrivivax sp.]